MLADSDGTVILRGLSLDRALQIVHELRAAGVQFDWYYKPPERLDGAYVRSVTFVFAQPKYAPWFELKYK